MFDYPELTLIVYYDHYGNIPYAEVKKIEEARQTVTSLSKVVPEFAKVRLYTIKQEVIEFLLEKSLVDDIERLDYL